MDDNREIIFKGQDQVLTKEDISYIFQAVLLNFDGVKLFDTMKYDIKTKHVIIANDVYDLIKRKW